MISRVAESCFWMNRYIERLENTARLLRINRSLILDYELPHAERWRPAIIVSGEASRFGELYGSDALDEGESIQEYLTWDEQSPVSIVSSLRSARENARTIRQVVSLDMWEALNGFWNWLKRGSGRRLFREDRDEFYYRLRDWPHLFYGLIESTVMHDEAYDFMRLGMWLERCGQTARLMDVRHHVLEQSAKKNQRVLDNASWLVLLHSCSAVEPFHKRYRQAPTGKNVAQLLILAHDFPRSLMHCVEHSCSALDRIRAAGNPEYGKVSNRKLQALKGRLAKLDPEEIIESGLHEQLTHVVDAVADICDSIRIDYFAPEVVSAQSQSQKAIQ